MSTSTFPNNMIHNCTRYITYDATKSELVCSKCSIVIEDPELMSQYIDESIALFDLSPDATKRATTQDHNAGDDLLDSLTPQMGYVSPQNTGVCFALGGTSAKDYQNRKVNKQLQDGYTVGNVTDEKGALFIEDPYTKEKKLSFSRYNVPLLNLWKREAEQRCTSYHLDTLAKSAIAKHLKRFYSVLMISGIGDLAVIAAILESKTLSPREAEILEAEYYRLLDDVRLTLLARGSKNTKAALKRQEESAKAKEQLTAPIH